MKKQLLTFTALVIFFFSLTTPISSIFAEEAGSSLITELHYDKEKKVLTGKTAPNANISLADVVATIVADDKGEFEVPIPDGLERTTLTFMDFINDESTDVDYDFVAGTIATEETKESTEQSEKQSEQAANSISSNNKQAASSVAKPVTPKEPVAKKETPIFIWVLLLVILILLTVLSLMFYKKRENEKKAAAMQENTGKMRRSRDRKRRR